MILFGVGSMWAANGTTTVHAYAMYDPDKNGVYDTEGGGTIRAYGTTADRWSSGSYVEGTTNSAGTYSFAKGTGYSGTIFKQSYKLKTSVITTQSGFYFAGWYKDKQLNTQETGNKDWEKTYSYNQNGGEITLYAIFKPVTVSSHGAVTNINVTNLYATATGAVTFNVANADEPSGGYYDNPHGVHVGLKDFISSLFIILMGTIVKGLAIITKSAEMSIATAKQNYDIEEVTDEINVSE